MKTVLQYKNVNLFGEGSAERCESGEGAACDKLAGGSELILELQKRSRDNKEKRARWSAEDASARAGGLGPAELQPSEAQAAGAQAAGAQAVL